MASPILERMCLLSIRREEMSKVKKFRPGKNIRLHVAALETKLAELEVKEDEQYSYLLESLEEDAKVELFSQLDYKDNKKSYAWLKEKLISLFKEKESEVTNLVELLNVKQRHDQSIREFVSQIRIQAWKIIGDANPELRESYSVLAFINGLRNGNCSTALRELAPKTLESAYQMVKHEAKRRDTKDCDNSIRIIANQNVHSENIIQKMMDEIRDLKILVTKLTSTVNNLTKPSYASAVARNDHYMNKPAFNNNNFSRQNSFSAQRKVPETFPENSFTCYNCGDKRHIARNCQQKLICRYCKEEGHLLPQCGKRPPRKQPPRFRKVEDEILSEPSTNEILCEGASYKEDDLDETMPNVAVMDSDWTVVSNRNRSRCRRGKYTKYSALNEIDEWLNFVNGDGEKPMHSDKPSDFSKQKATTVISRSNVELARNKPVVSCIVEGRSKNVFFDTGSENNVIDFEYVKSIGCKMIERQSGHMKCANGTPLKIMGYAVVNVSVGTYNFKCKCTVVEKIFPNLIIGLKTQKRQFIDISASRDCIIIRGEEVQFVSKVAVSEN